MALSKEQRANALTVLTRLAQREPKATQWLATVVSEDLGDLVTALDVAIATGEPMGQVLGSILAANPPPLEQLAVLQSRLPPHAMALHPLTVTLARLVADAEPADSLLRAGALTEYAERLAESGQAERGLAYAAEAVRLIGTDRDIKEDPRTIQNALRVLSLCQLRAGQRKAAIATAKKMVRMARPRGRRPPSIAYAEALVTLATRLPPDEDESIAIATQAIELLRTFVASALEGPLYPLRQTLRQERQPGDRLTIVLGSPEDMGGGPGKPLYVLSRGHDGEWGDPTPLVFVDPDVPDPVQVRLSLATALNARARRQLSAGRPREALADATEEIALLREVTTGQLDDPSMMLGLALAVAANSLFDLDETSQAIPLAREAVSRLWPFAAAEDTDYWRELIGIESRLLRAVLDDVTIGEIADRLRAMIGLLSGRDLDDRAGLAAGFADGIERLADFCVEHGWYSSELWACVVDCCRLASQDRPDAIPQLARALTGLATALHRDGQVGAALPVATEAVELSKRWAEQSNDRSYPQAALHGLARRLAAVGRFDEATDTAYQAVQCALQVEGPLTVPPLVLISAINNYTLYAAKAGRQPSVEARAFPVVAAALGQLTEEPDPQNLTMIATAAFSVMSEAARTGDVPAAAELYRQFIAVAERHPEHKSLLIYRALIAWYLVMCYVDHDAMDLAVGIYHDAARLAREHPELPLARVEHAKCATELIQPYQQRGDLRAAQEIVRDAEASLRSPEYLAAREQDLGQAPEEFLDQLDQLLAAAPED
jgi:tetratricopeptide (TPR) repeat protein